MLGLTAGAFPQGANVLLPMRFLNTDTDMGSITVGLRALSLSELFLAKFIVQTIRDPKQCMLLKVDIIKTTMKRSQLEAFLGSANRRKSVVGSYKISLTSRSPNKVAPIEE